MAPIYPLLVSADGFDSQQFASRPLTETDGVPVPLVAFARFDEQNQVKYTSWSALQKRGHGIQDIEGRALKDLVARGQRPGWEPQNVFFEDREVTILTRRGDVVTASDILDDEMMKIAANYFSVEQVFVGVPTQAAMIASDQGEYIHETIAQEFQGAAAAGLIPLSPEIYCVENGKIVGTAHFEAPVAQPDPQPTSVSMPAPEPAVAPTGAGAIPRVQPQIFSYEGSNAFWLSLPCNSYEGLYQAIQTEFYEYGSRLPNWEGFQGRIVFHVEPGSCRLTMEERNIITQLGLTLTQQAMKSGWRSPYGDQIAVLILLPPPGQDTGKVKREKPAPKTKTSTPAKGGRKFKTRGTVTGAEVVDAGDRPSSSGLRSKSKTLERKTRTRTGKTSSTSMRRTTTSGGTAATVEMNPEEAPATPASLKRQIPNKLGWAIWGFRIWYILLALGLGAFGILILASAILVKAADKAVKEANAAEQPAEPGAEPAADSNDSPAAAPASGINPEAVAAANRLMKWGILMLVGAVLGILMYELVLIRGLRNLRGWARGLGIFVSGIMVLLILPLPFGAFALLGLTNPGTTQLFFEAKNLRRLRRMK